VALQHLQPFPVLQADDVLRRDGLLDRHGGLQVRGGFNLLLWLTEALDRLLNGGDQVRKVGHLDVVLREIGGDDLRGQFGEITLRAVGSHHPAPMLDVLGLHILDGVSLDKHDPSIWCLVLRGSFIMLMNGCVPGRQGFLPNAQV
jgi:hypothetical protein